MNDVHIALQKIANKKVNILVLTINTTKNQRISIYLYPKQIKGVYLF